ncbi:MAG: 50S ribosomal protein L9 [Atribacterota bacterium]|jgi:large subunit ribosomal protein L9|nr:50S ribosomal protein L9 [Atribacterota bacterium]MDY0382978.1 50S ribosomal protein L9 [Atribacterota bacterium]
MKVILKENMDNLGYIGDVVEVNKGYARNFLFPRGLAIEYTSGNLKSMEHLKQKEWEKRNREILEAKELADKLNNLDIVFKAKAGKDGKLFGSITNKDIAQYLMDNYQIEIDRKKIEYDDTMKKIGDYPVSIRLHKEVNARLNVIIAPEEEIKKEESISDEDLKNKAK